MVETAQRTCIAAQTPGAMPDIATGSAPRAATPHRETPRHTQPKSSRAPGAQTSGAREKRAYPPDTRSSTPTRMTGGLLNQPDGTAPVQKSAQTQPVSRQPDTSGATGRMTGGAAEATSPTQYLKAPTTVEKPSELQRATTKSTSESANFQHTPVLLGEDSQDEACELEQPSIRCQNPKVRASGAEGTETQAEQAQVPKVEPTDTTSQVETPAPGTDNPDGVQTLDGSPAALEGHQRDGAASPTAHQPQSNAAQTKYVRAASPAAQEPRSNAVQTKSVGEERYPTERGPATMHVRDATRSTTQGSVMRTGIARAGITPNANSAPDQARHDENPPIKQTQIPP